MKAAIAAATTAIVIFASVELARAQDAATQTKPVVEAFKHYEGVRAALANDKLADVAAHAKQLAAQIPAVGGDGAKKAVDQLAAAKTIEDARTHFGELSTVLVPIFQAEAIPGTTAYMCSMKKKPWIQKGDKVENPYYGQAMLTCGSPLPSKGK